MSRRMYSTILRRCKDWVELIVIVLGMLAFAAVCLMVTPWFWLALIFFAVVTKL